MRYNITLLFFICTHVLYGQFTVSGKIVNGKTGQPVPFATVALLHQADSTLANGVITSDSGVFKIVQVKKGSYRLLVRSIGYQNLLKDSLIVNTSLNLGTLKIQEKTNKLNDVIVTATRSTVETHLGKKVLNIGTDLSTAGASVTDALERLPSVSTDIDGNVSIRGSSNLIIYVNGKETQRSSKSLRFLPAESLQRIEVITNPSAKYDAGGIGGIINLVFKKGASSNFKLETITSVSTPYRFSGGVNSQVSSQKLTGYINANIRRSSYENRDEQFRINNSSALERYDNFVKQDGKGRTAQLTGGLTIDIDTSFSLNFEYSYWRWLDAESRLQTNNFSYRDGSNRNINLRNQSRELEDEMSLSFSLDKDWGNDRNLKVVFNGGGEVEDNETDYNLDQVDLSGTPLGQTISRSKETEKQRLYQLTLDYTSPLAGFGKIETGLKFDDIRFEIAQTLDFVDQELFLPQNEFNIKLKKYAGYLIHKKDWKKFEYGLGVRLEHFTSNAHQITTQEKNVQEVTRLFPSVQLVYRPLADHQFAFNYSRRINRPGFFDLNPFVSFTDPLILQTGNPKLEPEFADSFELSYQFTRGIMSLDVVGFQRITTNVIQETVSAFDADRLIYSYTNFGKQMNGGAEVSLSLEPVAILELTANASWYNTRYEAGQDDVDVRFNNQSTWKADMQQRLNLQGDWSFELTESYRSPRIGIQSEDQANYYVNAAIRKSFANKRAVLTLNLQDVFDTRVFKTRLKGENFEVENFFKFQSRRLSLEFRYKIFD